jgi:hypothetical protein
MHLKTLFVAVEMRDGGVDAGEATRCTAGLSWRKNKTDDPTAIATKTIIAKTYGILSLPICLSLLSRAPMMG